MAGADRWIASAAAAAADLGHRTVLEHVATHLARGAGLDPAATALHADPPDPALAPPPGSPPDILAAVHERILRADASARRRAGAFFTPHPLADTVADRALQGAAGPVRVCDPAAGGGALLLAAARALVRGGATPADAVAAVHGIEIDALSADVADTSLALLSGRPLGRRAVEVGDALDPATWAARGRFDAVVANPPFRSQLLRATARSAPERARATAGFGAKGYADDAALFLVLALDLLRPGGTAAIILPEAVLATRDAAPARRTVGEATTLVSLIRAEGGFDAGARTCVATFRRTPGGGDAAWTAGTWSHLLHTDAPHVDLAAGGRLGDVAACTADFRDQYYGVAAVATDAAEPTAHHPGIVTCGLIDPARLRWGTRTARIAGAVRRHPVADLAAMAEPLQLWAQRRLVPKVMLATQTRVLEAAADEHGSWLPLVPVISIVPTATTTVWELLAVVLAPPVSAWAHRTYGGAALSADAVKLSARQVAQIPLPVDPEQWAAGAAAAHAASAASRGGDDAGWRSALDDLGEAMCRAYGQSPGPLLRWWSPHVDRIAARS